MSRTAPNLAGSVRLRSRLVGRSLDIVSGVSESLCITFYKKYNINMLRLFYGSGFACPIFADRGRGVLLIA